MAERFKYKKRCKHCKKWFIPKINNGREYCRECVPKGVNDEKD